MTEKTFHTVSWAPSAIKDAVEHATEAFKAADGAYARVSTFELSALIDATRALIEHNEQADAEAERRDAETAKLAQELHAWRTGARRRTWPIVEAAPDGISYAAYLARAQGTEGGEEHDRLLREAAQRMKGLHDAAQTLLEERRVLSWLHAEAVWHAKHHRAQVETQGLPLAVLRKGVRDLLSQNNAMARQIKALQAQLDQVPSPGACSCNPSLVVLHESGSYCGDPQYEAIHELLDAALIEANLAGEDGRAYGAASRAGDLVLQLLDILRGREEPKLDPPVTEVRLDGLVPDENLERLRAILRGDEPGPAAAREGDDRGSNS